MPAEMIESLLVKLASVVIASELTEKGTAVDDEASAAELKLAAAVDLPQQILLVVVS